MNNEKVTIIGAGLVGSLLAILLAKRGMKVSVYERRPDMRIHETEAGRSINLALSDRGWNALDMADVSHMIREISIPMHGRKMHDRQGNLSFLPYGKEGQSIYSVSRGELNATLMTLAEQHGVKFFFNQRTVDVDLENKLLFLENTITGQTTTEKAGVIFGTDGAFSAVRLRMQMTGRFEYHQQYMEVGYKELTIPAGPDGEHRLEKNALHIWPRGNHMMIALPNLDGSYTCTLFFPFEGKPSFDYIREEGVTDYFNAVFPDAVQHLPDLENEFENNPESSLVMVECFPWSYKGNLVMLGDAVHAMVPFYGQGMNCGFEDCVKLCNEIDKGGSWEEIFDRFAVNRKPDTDAICELARRNFTEMSDLSGDPNFLLRKKIEARFSKKYPELWTPLYEMVTFSDLPYRVALTEGNRQDKVMKEIMMMPGIEEKWDSSEVEEYMLRLCKASG